MPFLQTLNDLKDFTYSINPLSLLSPDQQPSPAPSSSSSPSQSAAPPNPSEAGPGPSSLASRNLAAVNQPSIYSSPPASSRPSLKHSSSSSLPPSSDSAESAPRPRGASAVNDRRKGSGTSVVVIADPEVTNMTRGRQKRAVSVASGITDDGDFGDRRGKKNPLDTYIIVKPPPASAKNPLNLQIQLIVKRSRRGRAISTSSNYSSLGSSPVDDRDVKLQSPTTPNLPSSAPMSPSTSMTGGSSSLPASTATSDVSDDEASIKRSSSIRSGMSSATRSTASGMSGKRIEPMFNLAVHNVVHSTVVTDAATDVKVAKFHKRVVDVSGVGIVEPTEIHLPSASNHLYPTISRVTSHVTSDGETLQTPGTKARPLSIASFSPSLSPVTTIHQEESRSLRSSLDLKNFRLDNILHHQKPDSGDSNTKKLFGKIFKKKKNVEKPKDAAIHLTRSASASSIDPKGAPGIPSNAVSPTNGSPAAGRASIHLPSSPSDFHHSSPSAVGHPTFGTSPNIVVRQPPSAAHALESRLKPELYSPTEKHHTISSRSRPIGYNWTVRRWARRNSEGWAAHLVAAAATGLELVGAAEMAGENEVRFEWVKGVFEPEDEPSQRGLGIGKPGGINLGQSKTGRAVSAPGHSAPSETGPKSSRRIASPMPSAPSSPAASRPPSPSFDSRPEPVRRVSAAASTSSSTASSKGVPNVAFDDAMTGGGETAAEEGDSSETEDSETPWSCWVWVKSTGQRQLLGTLTPAPHHPKVVGVLKIPMSLDPVSLTDIKGPPLNAVNGEQGQRTAMAMKKIKENVALTEENLKDMLCVTALWLVAREEYGGLGRVGGRRRRGKRHA
ncbi:uncharacterized protein IAS62_005165 [Cryptococcus decagattii]|uniref:Uncharacterized protein n=1 Tax=Cryptococcus decagattii TaxID=1859122 RepID=A0ABZ2B2X7_9TREE